MKGSVRVFDTTAWLERCGWGRGLHLKERAELLGTGCGRPVVVTIDDITSEGVILQLPLRVDILIDAIRLIELDNGEHPMVCIVASQPTNAPLGADPNLAAEFGVATEE